MPGNGDIDYVQIHYCWRPLVPLERCGYNTLKSIFQVPQGVPQMQQQQQPSGGQFQQQQLPQQPAVGVNPVPVNRGGGPPPQAQPGLVINSALVCYLFYNQGSL